MEVVVSLFLGTEGMKKEKVQNTSTYASAGGIHTCTFFFHYTVTQMMFTKINLAMTTDEDKS